MIACKACGHAMKELGTSLWWCPWCGTIMTRVGMRLPEEFCEQWTKPKLVKRALDLCEEALDYIVHVTSYREEPKETPALERKIENVFECALSPEER